MCIRINSILILAAALLPTQIVAEKPNLVFIVADDCTFRDIGCYGGQAKTPNIDRLALQGLSLIHI